MQDSYLSLLEAKELTRDLFLEATGETERTWNYLREATKHNKTQTAERIEPVGDIERRYNNLAYYLKHGRLPEPPSASSHEKGQRPAKSKPASKSISERVEKLRQENSVVSASDYWSALSHRRRNEHD